MSGTNEPEIACRLDALTTTERAKHALELQRLLEAAGAPVELADGFALPLPDAAAAWAAAIEWIALERRCCPFLAFTLRWPAAGGVAALEVTGPPGAKPILAAAFAGARPGA